MNRPRDTERAVAGAQIAVGTTTTLADGGYRGTGLAIPHVSAGDMWFYAGTGTLTGSVPFAIRSKSGWGFPTTELITCLRRRSSAGPAKREHRDPAEFRAGPLLKVVLSGREGCIVGRA